MSAQGSVWEFYHVLPCFRLYQVTCSAAFGLISSQFLARDGCFSEGGPLGSGHSFAHGFFLGTDSFKKENLFADSWNLSEDSGLFLHFCTGDLPISVMFEVFQSLVYTVYPLQRDSCRPDERPCLSCDASQPENLRKLLWNLFQDVQTAESCRDYWISQSLCASYHHIISDAEEKLAVRPFLMWLETCIFPSLKTQQMEDPSTQLIEVDGWSNHWKIRNGDECVSGGGPWISISFPPLCF